MAKFGISLYGFRPEHIVPAARHAEALGFDGVWLGEHVLQPVRFAAVHPYDEGKARPPLVTETRTMVDIWLMVGAIIGATRRIAVTTGVHLLAQRHPIHSARAAITAQQASGGRFRLGVGVGWWREEFESLGVPYEERASRFDEALRLLPRLFAGEVVANDGPAYPFRPLKLTEVPVRVPLILGGTKGRALERIARVADGWYGPMAPIDEALAAKREIERLRAALGRSGPFAWEVRARGEPTLDGYRPYLDAGFDTIVVPNETIQAGVGFEMTLDEKYRRLEVIAKALDVRS